MNTKKTISFFLLYTFALAFVIQSADAVSHYLEEITVKKCIHTAHSKADVTHEHHKTENCPVCHFSFSSFDQVSFLNTILFNSSYQNQVDFSITQEKHSNFKRGFFSLRAPPFV